MVKSLGLVVSNTGLTIPALKVSKIIVQNLQVLGVFMELWEASAKKDVMSGVMEKQWAVYFAFGKKHSKIY